MSENYDSTPPRVKLVKGQEVSLGCGTLILIALIVLFCGGMGNSNSQELKKLQQAVDALEQSVDEQTELLKKMQTRIEELAKKE